MSRHHPYSGYDDAPLQNGGHRKLAFGNRGSVRGSNFSRRGGASHNGFSNHNHGGGSKTSWESNTGPDRNYSEHGSFERELPHFSRSGHKGMKSRGVRGKLRGGFSKVHAERELSIDERIQRERPCRTLFVRNVKYETNSHEVREKFEQMGEIKIFFDLIPTRGMAFITYYDLRAATIAKEKLQGTNVSGRPIDVHYSLPKDNELERRCDREKNQATLFLAVNGANSPIDDDELKAKFEAYGEIRSIKHFKDSPCQRFVEFWDSRACEQAHDDLVGSHYLGGKIDLKFSWDTGMVPKARLSKERRGHDDDSYNYEHFDDNYYDQEERSDHDNYTHGGHNASEDDGDHYGSRGSHQSNSVSYSSNSTILVPKAPSNANDVDLGRLDQAQKVQELLASLTKPGVGTIPPSFGTGSMASLPLPVHPLVKYPTETPAPTSSSQSTFVNSSIMSMQLPPNFTPNYPAYPAAHSNETATSNGFKDLAQIIGQLRNTSSPANPSLNEHTSIPSINYSPANEAPKTPAVLFGANNNQPNAQPTLTLPPSVLNLLQQQNGGNSASTYPSSLSSHNIYPLIKSDSSPSLSIPTAPRAMQQAANVNNSTNNYLPTQSATHLLNSMTGPLKPGESNASLALPGSAKQASISDFPVASSSLNQTKFGSIPPVGTVNPDTNAAVQQLLALLQQQQNRPNPQ